MDKGMVVFLFHPAAMGVVILLALYVLALGLQRARATLLGHGVSFPWKHHAIVGKLVMMGLLAGMLVGSLVVSRLWWSFPLEKIRQTVDPCRGRQHHRRGQSDHNLSTLCTSEGREPGDTQNWAVVCRIRTYGIQVSL